MLVSRPMRLLLAFSSLAFALGAGCGGGQASAPDAESPSSAPPSGGSESESAANGSSDASGIGAEKDAEMAGVQGKTETFPEAASLDALKQKLGKGSLEGVARLDLAGRALGSGLGKLLGSSSALSGLAALDVSDNDLGTDGVRAFAKSSRLGALHQLEIAGRSKSATPGLRRWRLRAGSSH